MAESLWFLTTWVNESHKNKYTGWKVCPAQAAHFGSQINWVILLDHKANDW